MARTFSKNTKLNSVLNVIADQLENFGLDEVKRYMKEFKNEPDYNIAQYGNLLCYYDDVRDLYLTYDYSNSTLGNDAKLWNIYKRQVGYVAREITRLTFS